MFNTLGDDRIYKAGHTQQAAVRNRLAGYLGPNKPRMLVVSKRVADSLHAERLMLQLLASSRAFYPRPDLGPEWFERDPRRAARRRTPPPRHTPTSSRAPSPLRPPRRGARQRAGGRRRCRAAGVGACDGRVLCRARRLRGRRTRGRADGAAAAPRLRAQRPLSVIAEYVLAGPASRERRRSDGVILWGVSESASLVLVVACLQGALVLVVAVSRAPMALQRRCRPARAMYSPDA